MKYFNYIYQSIFAIGIVAGTISCNHETSVISSRDIESEGLPVAVSLKSNSLSATPSLDYSVYIFSHSANISDESYLLDTLISPIGENSRLKFSNDDLNQKDYRFLFTATPSGIQETSIVTSGSLTKPTPGTRWENIRLVLGNSPLSAENYYRVNDLSGKEILATDTVHARLTRVVGQMLFNFFKVDPDTHFPIPTDTTGASIFDRIDTVQITYTDYSSQLSFSESGELTPADTIARPLIQNIYLTLNDRLETPIPQAEADTLAGGIRAGGRLRGLYFLPVTQNLRATLVFHYYDTTPKCGNPAHSHDRSCYTLKTLELQLPPNNATSRISIEPDTYTINKAGIFCNRIIDIGISGGYELDTQWNTNP